MQHFLEQLGRQVSREPTFGSHYLAVCEIAHGTEALLKAYYLLSLTNINKASDFERLGQNAGRLNGLVVDGLSHHHVLSPCAEMIVTREHVHSWFLQGLLSSAKQSSLCSIHEAEQFGQCC